MRAVCTLPPMTSVLVLTHACTRMGRSSLGLGPLGFCRDSPKPLKGTRERDRGGKEPGGAWGYRWGQNRIRSGEKGLLAGLGDKGQPWAQGTKWPSWFKPPPLETLTWPQAGQPRDPRAP